MLGAAAAVMQDGTLLGLPPPCPFSRVLRMQRALIWAGAQVAAVLDDKAAPLEYASAAQAFLAGKLRLAWADAAEQRPWCHYHLGTSAPPCAAPPLSWLQPPRPVLVVFAAGGGAVHR